MKTMAVVIESALPPLPPVIDSPTMIQSPPTYLIDQRQGCEPPGMAKEMEWWPLVKGEQRKMMEETRNRR